jgi:hypothetical protein
MKLALVAALGVADVPASAQIVVTIRIPPAVIATATPVYFENRPTYWYDNHWYYRDANRRWTYYRNEPPYLRAQRMSHPPRYYHYGR